MQPVKVNRTLADKVLALKLVNPKRKLLLLALVHKAEQHCGAPLPEFGAPFFEFDLCPIELQTILESNLKPSDEYLSQLERQNFIIKKTNYTDPLNWKYTINLRPLCVLRGNT